MIIYHVQIDDVAPDAWGTAVRGERGGGRDGGRWREGCGGKEGGSQTEAWGLVDS